MARTALEHALPAGWIDAVFDEHRERQYSRELLFSTVVELVTLVSLGLRPSLHAAARTMETLPVTLAALYDKVNRTEPGILRALVRGSAERLAPVAAAVDGGTILPGWHLRVLDGNHLPASEKRLAPLREHRGAALPGQTLVVYDPDSGLVTDIVASEDAHQSERASVAPLLDSAQPGQLWIADRHFCTRVIMQGWDEAHASFIVREHAFHPRLVGQEEWRGCGRTETGQVCEQAIEVAGARWRRIELALDKPTEAGERVIRLWSNLSEEISAARIAELYRTRWRIEGMFQRLESVLNSEIRSLGGAGRKILWGWAAAGCRLRSVPPYLGDAQCCTLNILSVPPPILMMPRRSPWTPRCSWRWSLACRAGSSWPARLARTRRANTVLRPATVRACSPC